MRRVNCCIKRGATHPPSISWLFLSGFFVLCRIHLYWKAQTLAQGRQRTHRPDLCLVA